MWSKIALLAFLLCHPVKETLLESPEEVNTEGPQSVSADITQLIFDEILSKVTLSQNFLISPEQVKRLLQTYGKHETSTAQFVQDLEGDGAAASAEDSHMFVSNKLLNDPVEIKRSYKSLNATELLVNAVSVKAGWKLSFHRRDSHKRMFHSKHRRNLYTEAMRKDDVYPYAELDEAKAKAVQLSLQNSNYKMLIILPNEPDGLFEVVQYFRDHPKAIDEMLHIHLRHALVRVILPKFQIAHHVVVNRMFEKLMVEDVDGSHTATKTATIVQTTVIKVSEDGIGDFDNKKVLFWNAFSSARITPEIFDMSHPFLFIIGDEEKVQFVGVLNEIA